ncbi:MAG TPA: YlaF family protein [Bacillus sp. (in: firmicutes)]|jgi:hypothetical protein
MKKIKSLFLLFALVATSCIMGIGISVAERSIIGIISCILLLILVMGIGFITKKKMRENGFL